MRSASPQMLTLCWASLLGLLLQSAGAAFADDRVAMLDRMLAAHIENEERLTSARIFLSDDHIDYDGDGSPRELYGSSYEIAFDKDRSARRAEHNIPARFQELSDLGLIKRSHQVSADGERRTLGIYENGSTFEAEEWLDPQREMFIKGGERRNEHLLPAWRRHITAGLDSYLAFGEEKLGDRVMIVVETTKEREGRKKYYFDPQKAYSLIRLDSYVDDGSLLHRVEYDVREVAAGVWFAVDRRFSLFDTETGKLRSLNRASVDLDRSSFNRPELIPASIYQISKPGSRISALGRTQLLQALLISCLFAFVLSVARRRIRIVWVKSPVG